MCLNVFGFDVRARFWTVKMLKVFLCSHCKQDQSVVIIVVLVFYGPSAQFRSFRVRPVILSTLFLGKTPRQFTSTVSAHSSPVTDNCPSWIGGENGRRNYYCNYPKICTKWVYNWAMCPQNAGRLANSADPDQTASSGTIWSVFTLFVPTRDNSSLQIGDCQRQNI